MTAIRFSTLDDVTSDIMEGLGLDTYQREDVETAVRRYRDVPYERLHGATYERLQRRVWNHVTGGAEWPFPEPEPEMPGFVEVPAPWCPDFDFLRQLPQAPAEDLLETVEEGETPYRVTAGELKGAVILFDDGAPRARLFVPSGGEPFVLSVEPTGDDDFAAGTIDADLMVGSEPLSVTLCPALDGRDAWESYGHCLDSWVSDPDVLCDAEGDSDRDLILDVLSAVDAAARRAGLSPLAADEDAA